MGKQQAPGGVKMKSISSVLPFGTGGRIWRIEASGEIWIPSLSLGTGMLPVGNLPLEFWGTTSTELPHHMDCLKMFHVSMARPRPSELCLLSLHLYRTP